MPKRLKLEVGSHIPYQMLGIATTLPDFRLAHFLSGITGLSFIQQGSLDCFIRGARLELPFFAALDRINALHYFVLANKGADFILFPSERRFDFWLLIGGEGKADIPSLVKQLQKMGEIQFSARLDPHTLKEAHAFFEDLEVGTSSLLRQGKGGVAHGDALW
jgi:hypothetical protein